MYKTVYFPNRDELSFQKVLAFPKASSKGLHAKILSSIGIAKLVYLEEFILVKKVMHLFVDSVLPAPDSPEMQIA